MREITAHLTPEIQRHIGAKDVAAAAAYPVQTYRDLVHHIARLAILNKDYHLLYRGQGREYLGTGGRTSLYPSIYRGSQLTPRALQDLFSNLERASRELRSLIQAAGLEGQEDAGKRLVLWSLLQHYQVCVTPLLDFTSSIRVACSFGIHGARDDEVYVYVCAFPYARGRISVDSEHDLVNVRLLGICPPDALRPVFQEGYLAETYETTSEYGAKQFLDFNRRLVAKFRIPATKSFWEDVASIIPRRELYPDDDPLLEIAELVKRVLGEPTAVGPSEIGHFLQQWARLERAVLSLATLSGVAPRSFGKAVQFLGERGIPRELLRLLDETRRLRNRAVHSPDELTLEDLARLGRAIPLLLERVEGLYGQVSADGFPM